ncbi:11081_t:CDS:2 [Funneliformis geosporum]|nr:11081_t:CDS:2 [Funneliformis geosporum]
MTRKRTINSIINDKPQENRSFCRSIYKRRLKLRCYYNVFNGKFVDPHIKELHDIKDQNSSIIGSGSSASASLYQFNQIQQNAQDDETADESEFVFLPRRPRRSKRHAHN